jgi:hypothetical protein
VCASTEVAEWRWASNAVAYILDHAELTVVMVEASKLANLIKARFRSPVAAARKARARAH